MSKIFYLSEIVNFAIGKERESYDLYKTLHDRASAEKMKTIFLDLMNQEKRHEQFYQAMAANLKDQSSTTTEDEAYVAYMKELIKTSQRVTMLSKDDLSNRNKILDFAIAREKDSILFYVGLKNFISDESKKTVDKIIQEEGGHIARLIGLKE